MHVGIHGSDTRSSKIVDLYVLRVIGDNHMKSFDNMAGSLWNKLPTGDKESATLHSFKQNHMYSEGWMK